MYSILFSLFFVFLSSAAYADDAVVAKVNGTIITSRDLDAEVGRLVPATTYHGNVSDDRLGEYKEKALEDLITRELQYQDAITKGIKPDQKQVKTQMTQIRDRFKSKKEYRLALQQAGTTEDQLRMVVEKGVVVNTVISKMVLEPAQMSEGALNDYYEKNITKFKQPEEVKLRLISTKDEKKAHEALDRIKDGEEFGNVATKLSEDNYRIMGGNIGYVHRGRVIKEIEDIAFNLNVGVASGLIKAGGTWYIIKVDEKKPEHQMTFEESRVKLKKELEAKRAQEFLASWMASLKEKAHIEIPQKKETN